MTSQSGRRIYQTLPVFLVTAAVSWPIHRDKRLNQGNVVSNLTSEKISECLNTDKYNIMIIGGGIAGLSTARYLLSHTPNYKNVTITIIDRNYDTIPSKDILLGSSYGLQNSQNVHKAIPSRRNGNVLCPSSTIPWTQQPLWKGVCLPKISSFFYHDKGKSMSPAVSFDWSILTDVNMWSFALHLILQKWLFGRPEHQSNKSILEYSMTCLDDPTDDLIQSIDYKRCAKGTKRLDGTIAKMDSSGEIGLFCDGLLNQLISRYDDKITFIPGEEVVTIESNDETVRGVTTLDQYGNRRRRDADAIVVACGIKSTDLCKSIKVICPLYPAKGHLVTVASKCDYEYNMSLPGGVGYAAPMARFDSHGRRLYRLSGFVDFTLTEDTDSKRVEALLDAARVNLPDLELIDSSACHRPMSADDRPIVGPSDKFSNLFLCTGLGSRGWSMGLGCGKLLASQILGLPCDIDPEPYLPSRFCWNKFAHACTGSS